MKEKDIETKITHAFSAIVPEAHDKVISYCTKQKGTVTSIMYDKKKTNKKALKWVAGIAAVLILFIGVIAGVHLYQYKYAVDCIISIDVNPSIEIKVNQKGTVLDVIARNEDAKVIIGNMDFRGSSIELTVNALVGSLLRNGYLTEIANSILVSVDGNDSDRDVELQSRISNEIKAMLDLQGFNAAILSQTITSDDELEELADSYSISSGKAQLIHQIISHNTDYTFDELAALSINELVLLSEAKNVSFDNIEASGTASTKAYIDAKQAKEIAFESAGIDNNDSVYSFECELDCDNGKIVYSISFVYNSCYYKYEIDAVTGDIIKNDEKYKDKNNSDLDNVDNDDIYDYDDNKDDSNYNKKDYSKDSNNHNNEIKSDSFISEDRVKSIVLAHAAVSFENIENYGCKLITHKEQYVYTAKFKYNGYKYEYEVDALTGNILDFEKEADDDAS